MELKTLNQEDCKAGAEEEEDCWKCYQYNQCSVNNLKSILTFVTIVFALSGLNFQILEFKSKIGILQFIN